MHWLPITATVSSILRSSAIHSQEPKLSLFVGGFALDRLRHVQFQFCFSQDNPPFFIYIIKHIYIYTHTHTHIYICTGRRATFTHQTSGWGWSVSSLPLSGPPSPGKILSQCSLETQAGRECVYNVNHNTVYYSWNWVSHLNCIELSDTGTFCYQPINRPVLFWIFF